MTLNDPFPKKPRPRTQVWLTRSCYSQNIPRTMASLVNEWGSSPVGGDQTLWEKWTRRPVSRVLCRPSPKRRTRRSFLWTAPRGTVLATYPDRPGLRQPCPPSPRLRRAHGPYSVLLLAGLAMPSLLPGTRWALTPPFHPSLSGERRFAFCGAIPGVAPGGRYPPPCRRGARTFLDPLAEAATARPSGPRGRWRRRRQGSTPTLPSRPPGMT